MDAAGLCLVCRDRMDRPSNSPGEMREASRAFCDLASDATAPQRYGEDSRLRDATQTPGRLRPVRPRDALPTFDTIGTAFVFS